MALRRFWALAPRACTQPTAVEYRHLLPASLSRLAPHITHGDRSFAGAANPDVPGAAGPEVPEEVKTPADRLAEGVASQFDDAAAALASDERTAAEHMASRAEAAADKLEGRASGTYQAQMEHAAIAFEDAAKRESHDGQASSSSAPEHGGQETVAERTTLADTASGLATQVVAGLRDGAAGVVSNVREVVGSMAEQAGGAAAKAKQQVGGADQAPQVGQPADVEGQPSGVSYDGGPASAKDAGAPSQPVEPPFTTRVSTGDGGESEARAESQTSPFAEGVWQDAGQVYDVHPRGQGVDRESDEQLRERARQDAERG